ncbi:protein crumbs homolog 2b [Electrophorus electricus]|uniref:protein crumbs homolog 2b n=1 Tax=Electrophorus electricus TaxID=8005 RepID=UPI0015D01613|nr:protein crumbs homolog 2b [Electrophorus electricus]
MEFGRVYSRHQKTVLLTMMFKLGIFSAATADICASSPCQHGGTCIDEVTDYTCICPEDSRLYTGKDCALLYDPCVHASCPNCSSVPGTENYTCPCTEGVESPGCTQNIDDCVGNPCAGVKSRCVDDVAGYSCHCPRGYDGEDCQTRLSDCTDDPCSNNGTCVPTPDGFTCLCGPGFQGNHCEHDTDECLSQPCQNGAICLQGIDMYMCFCVPGFQGYHCEIDINECASQPCKNNGTCVNRKDRYTCDCLLGFKGVNCEVEIDECEGAPCQNGATCRDYVGLYTCECAPGYEGEDCEVDIDECAAAACLNRGTCVDMVNSYVCDCNGTGFVGEFCEEDILECASDPCQHGATCQEGVNQYTCLCWPGYEGANCEVDVDECEPEPCENGGVCVQHSQAHHYGVLPGLPETFSYEHANGFLCRCPAGFAGDNCSVNVDECASAPCKSGGRCEDLINAYRCVCPPGFEGVVCESNIDECKSTPCKNRAFCEDGINEYICHCRAPPPEQPPWGGRDCDTLLVGCVDQPCQNGGTCLPLFHEDQHHYICKCPPGFHGDRCTVPTTFSISTADHVLVEVPRNRTAREAGPHTLTVALRFRTALPDAVLFFRGRADHFFTLEMTGGSLLATAETANLQLELQLPGDFNDGLWHEVFVSVDGKHIRISRAGNVTGPVTRDHKQPFHTQGLEELYIGGAPQDCLNKTKTGKGFIGCMEDLIVDTRPILPQNVFPQLGCNKTEWCDPDPCSQQGHCVDLWTEYRCDCHRPFYGVTCAHEHTPWTFSHEKKRSFAAFPITRNHGGNVTVSFFLKSLKHDGLVFQLRRGDRAYFTVFLKGGVVYVAMSSSVQGIPKLVTDGNKALVAVDIQGGFLYINRTEFLFSAGNFTAFEVKAGDMVYLGGLPEANDTVPWGGHFKGCLQDVRLDDTQLYMYLDRNATKPEHTTYLRSVLHDVLEHCVSDQACMVQPCLNGGKCQLKWNDFVCSCPLNYTGKTCETRVWCASDPCILGSWCVDLPDGYECLANATFENNALKYNANGSLSASVTTVSVDLRTRAESGTVLRATDGLRFFSLGLWNSTLLLKIRSGDSPEELAFNGTVVSDGEWHRVKLSRSGSRHAAWRWVLDVDGHVTGFIQADATNLDFFNHSTVWLAENFTGCLGEVRVGGLHLPLVEGAKDERPQSSRFVLYGGGMGPQMGCAGAPLCLSRPCLNNGLCRDLFNRYSCECAPGWEGEVCQNAKDECASGPCVHGTCRDLLGEYQCECARGYGGRRCEEDVDECQEQPCANGSFCQNTVGGYTCICMPPYGGQHCQWPFPSPRCEDVQCANGGVCTDSVLWTNCTCKPGYTGDRCEVEIDECISNPCLNGATCVDRPSRYLCDCLPGFSGANCETPRKPQGERVPWLLVALPLACLGALLAAAGLVCMALTARRKRRSEGTYSPSQQEVAGARLEMGSVLKVPPEERLI